MVSTDVTGSFWREMAELEQQLKEAGKQLLHPPDSVDELLSVLDQVEKLLTKVDQFPKKSMLAALEPSMKALIQDSLSKHSDVDVKVAVASCISEITRITAPDAPYNDDQMRDVFRLIVSSFEDLADQSSRSYNKRVSILETVSKVRSYVVMLDLECDELIVEMFEHFFKSVRDYHLDSIFPLMENIMVLVLEESADISVDMLKPLLASVKRDSKGVLQVARKLGERVLLKSAAKLKPYLMPALVRKSKQSGKKMDTSEPAAKKPKQSGKKVDAKAEESDSDGKPLTLSVKKGEKSKAAVEEEEESDSEKKPLKLSARKSNTKKKDDGKKLATGKNVTEKGQAKSLSTDDEMDSSKKSGKGEANSKETTPVTSAKRKRATGKDKVSDTIKYDESLVGTKVKVWWPEDKMYYEGVVAEFYPVEQKHKVLYVDWDEEILNLKRQKWKILQEFTVRLDETRALRTISPVPTPDVAPWGDPVVHHWLEFKSQAKRDRLAALQQKPIELSRYMDWSSLDCIGVRERAQLMCGPIWTRFFSISHPTYRELTQEFASTFSFLDPLTDYNHCRALQFRLGGRKRSLSLREFATRMELYTPEELDTPLFTDGLVDFPQGVSAASYWPQIGDGEYTGPLQPKATRLHDPFFHIIHSLVASTICFRHEGLSSVPEQDMFFLYCLIGGHTANVAYCLARFLTRISGACPTSPIFGGAYITRLALSYGLLPEHIVDQMLTIGPAQPINRDVLLNMGVIQRTPAGYVMIDRHDQPWPVVQQCGAGVGVVVSGDGGGGGAVSGGDGHQRHNEEPHDQPEIRFVYQSGMRAHLDRLERLQRLESTQAELRFQYLVTLHTRGHADPMPPPALHPELAAFISGVGPSHQHADQSPPQ